MVNHVWIGVRVGDKPAKDRQFSIATVRLKHDPTTGDVSSVGRLGANPFTAQDRFRISYLMSAIGNGLDAQAGNVTPIIPAWANVEPLQTMGGEKPDLQRYAMVCELNTPGLRFKLAPEYVKPERMLGLAFAWRALAIVLRDAAEDPNMKKTKESRS